LSNYFENLEIGGSEFALLFNLVFFFLFFVAVGGEFFEEEERVVIGRRREARGRADEGVGPTVDDLWAGD
jgi:hypothetical protein